MPNPGSHGIVPNVKEWSRHVGACRQPDNPLDAQAFRLAERVIIPVEADDITLNLGDCRVPLSNLGKPFWPELGILKRDLLQYYADISPYLLPHIAERAMVMKRYPNGAAGDFFFMKRAPSPRPDFIDTCTIEHSSGNVIDFPVIQDLPSLLWLVNLGCIDLNPWYARCDSINQPDFMHFDLDPGPGAGFDQVRDAAMKVKQALDEMGMPSFAKTSGSRGIHVYVPIVRGPLQKQVWTVAKRFALAMEQRAPDIVTAEYKVAKRPHARVLVDYNQNAWGRTLASVYSVRPTPAATISAPVTWEEIENSVEPGDFIFDTVLERVGRMGDLWTPVIAEAPGRFDLSPLLDMK